MRLTKKINYDRSTLAFKVQAVKLANRPGIMSKDIADYLSVHPCCAMAGEWHCE